MQNTRFFDVNNFNSYLKNNLKKGILKIESNKGNKETFYARGLQVKSFEIIPEEFLANDSITQGNYFDKGIRCHWEELRFRVHKSFLLIGDHSIPKGKYRVRVVSEEACTPVVETFVRGFGRWKRENLPEALPLSEILNGNLEGYIIE